eukprot:12910217-Prorocentrum_lima.AAC.1
MAESATKEIKRVRKHEKRQKQLEVIDKSLDVRDSWLRLRNMKKEFTPVSFSRRLADGTFIPENQIAEHSATYLQNHQWSLVTDVPPPRSDRLVPDDLLINDGPFSISEII